VGEVTAGEISSLAENHDSHLDVLSLEYLERAQPENFQGDNENTGQSSGADQGRVGLLSKALGKLELSL